MAKVGMRCPVFAPIEAETPGQPIQYGAGFFISKAISADVDLEHADARLYGDDALQDRDNSVIGGTETLNVTSLELETKAKLLGMKYNEETQVYSQTGKASPYGGHGYISEERQGNQTKYECIWFHKVQFAQNSFADNTKGQQLEFNTPTITGEIMGVQIDSSGDTVFYDQKAFEQREDALTWLKGQANITEAQPQQASSTAEG